VVVAPGAKAAIVVQVIVPAAMLQRGSVVEPVVPAGIASLTTTPAGSSEGPSFFRVIVYVVEVPAVTVVTPSDFVTDRSADVFTTFESVPVLLALFGSVVDEVAVAEFTCGLAVVELGTVYVTVTVAFAPLAMIPSEQLKLGLPVQVPCEGVTVPRANPAGQVSLSDTACASDGPSLWTVIAYVYVVPSPAVTLVTESDFVTDRSAEVVTVFESVPVLLLPSGSVVDELAVAELTCGLAVVDDGTV
jgi:hypothetical protein